MAVDAIVIGSGPNGLVAANAMADAGWDVLVLEAQSTIGGAVRSSEPSEDGFTTDLYSAFYPLAAASPVMRALDLESYGLEWVHAPSVLAHQCDDGSAVVLHRDVEATAAGLDHWAPGDGEAWIRMFREWQRVRAPLLDALFTPFPPVLAGARMLRVLRTAGAVRMARMAAMPVRTFAAEQFGGDGARLLLTGNALHTDLSPITAGSAVYGWLMSMLAQDVGFPVPRGGAGRLSQALGARAESRGVEVRTGASVTRVLVSAGRASGVQLEDGTTIAAKRAVVADVAAPDLYERLLAGVPLPHRLLRDLLTFEWDNSTVKLDWALSRRVPWVNEGPRSAGTVHLGPDLDGLVDFGSDLAVGRMPRTPFILFGQMTTADPSRSPEGTESAWAYTHLPRRLAGDQAAISEQVTRVHDSIERVAPGFAESILRRTVQSPDDLQAANANLVGGAINGGTSALHQQLVLRPTPGLGRPETPVDGLYLASASTHPGGGVHGACGWNAARAALRSGRLSRALRHRLERSVWA